jgi:hypothetical protein
LSSEDKATKAGARDSPDVDAVYNTDPIHFISRHTFGRRRDILEPPLPVSHSHTPLDPFRSYACTPGMDAETRSTVNSSSRDLGGNDFSSFTRPHLGISAPYSRLETKTISRLLALLSTVRPAVIQCINRTPIHVALLIVRSLQPIFTSRRYTWHIQAPEAGAGGLGVSKGSAGRP